MDPGEKRITGTRDEHYDLITVLYHALQGAETDEEYALDAEAAGDEQLASFFREAQDTHRHLAERAKELLGILEVSPEPEVAPDVPLEGTVLAEEVPPATGVARTPPGPASVPDEGIVTEPGGVSPERPRGEAPPAGDTRAADVPPDVPPPHIPVASPLPEETPGEPSRATPEQQVAAQEEREQGDKGLIEKAIDKLTGREEEENDRRGRR
jgi:hypothetical protein